MTRHTINATRASFITGTALEARNDNQTWHGQALSFGNPRPESVNQSSPRVGTELHAPINGRGWLAAMLTGAAMWLALAWLVL